MKYGDRPAFCILVACIVGLLVASIGPHWWVGAALLAAVTPVALLLYDRQIRHKTRPDPDGGYEEIFPFDQSDVRRRSAKRDQRFLLFLPLLAAVFALYVVTVTRPQRSLPDGATLYDVEVRVSHPVAATAESAVRYDAAVRTADGVSIRLLLSVPETMDVSYGTLLRGDLDLVSLTREDTGSYERYLLSEGYDAIGYGQRLRPTGVRRHTLRCRLMEERQRLIDRFDQAVETHLTPADKGLLYALCLGDRLHLPRTVREHFTAAGVAHILAVSGYHLGVVFALIGALLKGLLPGYGRRRIRSLILILILTLYTLLTGAGTATLRALVMSTAYLLSTVFDRRSDPVQVLSLTLLLFIIIRPYSLYSIGLTLSISAVWGLTLLMPLLTHFVDPRRPILRHAWSALAACIAAQVGIAPFLFLYFGRAAGSMLWSAIPIVLLSGLLIPLGLIALLWTGLFGTLPALYAGLLHLLTGAMRLLTDHFATPALSLSVRMEYDGILLLLYYAIVVVAYDLLIRRYHRRSRRLSSPSGHL